MAYPSARNRIKVSRPVVLQVDRGIEFRSRPGVAATVGAVRFRRDLAEAVVGDGVHHGAGRGGGHFADRTEAVRQVVIARAGAAGLLDAGEQRIDRVIA